MENDAGIFHKEELDFLSSSSTMIMGGRSTSKSQLSSRLRVIAVVGERLERMPALFVVVVSYLKTSGAKLDFARAASTCTVDVGNKDSTQHDENNVGRQRGHEYSR